jgi:hypothetical protein
MIVIAVAAQVFLKSSARREAVENESDEAPTHRH